ncbi:MAG: AMP-binding protein [Chloroflexaceae bacterium]|nr:AMP-binding protein [Chloroflexaceae bacterium]
MIPLDTQIPRDSLAQVLRDSETRFIFTTTNYLKRIEQLAPEGSVHITLLDVADDDERGWRALLSSNTVAFPTVQPDDTVVMFYTSGTTGVPKGVPLSHQNLTIQIKAVFASRLLQENEIILMPLPMYHVYPFSIGILTPLAFGACVVLPQSLTGRHLLEAMQQAQPTIMVAVPRLYRALYNRIETQVQARGALSTAIFRRSLQMSIWLRRSMGVRVGKLLFKPIHETFGKNMHLLASGGSALDPELAWKLEGIGFRVGIGYGLTETAPLLTLNLPDVGTMPTFKPGSVPRFASVGVPLSNVDIRIDTNTSNEDGEESPSEHPEGQGEILARGPGVFGGYRNLPEQTAKAFTEDGWFRTGDLGYIDGDGFVYVTGRASTLIVTEGGKNVQPEPVEEVYQASQFISEIGVLQHDNRLVGLIVPDMEEVTRWRNGDIERAIRDGVRAQSKELPTYQRIADYAITMEPLPKTNLGKIRRHLLRERYVQALKGETIATTATGPIALEDMTERDRELLQNPQALHVWELLARRYEDRRLTPDTSPQLELGIDSLSWLNLTVEIQEQTGVELTEEAANRISTVRDLLREVAQGRPDQDRSSESIQELLAHPEDILTPEQQQWFRPIGPILRVLAVLLFTITG